MNNNYLNIKQNVSAARLIEQWMRYFSPANVFQQISYGERNYYS